MLDVVALGQVSEHLDECWAIICDNFTKCTPSAEDVFEDPITDGLCGLGAEQMVFREVCKGAMAVNKILEVS